MAKASEIVTTIAKNKQNLSLTIENSSRQSVYIWFWCYQGYHEVLAISFQSAWMKLGFHLILWFENRNIGRARAYKQYNNQQEHVYDCTRRFECSPVHVY